MSNPNKSKMVKRGFYAQETYHIDDVECKGSATWAIQELVPDNGDIVVALVYTSKEDADAMVEGLKTAEEGKG